MAPFTTHEGDLDQVVELNRLFLRVVRARADGRGACLGLDAGVVQRIREASPEWLDELAELPRALFRLDLAALLEGESKTNARRERLDGATESLQLTVMLTAWNFSRRRVYAARLFLGLTGSQVGALRGLPLSDLPPRAASRVFVGGAFEGMTWLWHELLTESRPEQRRQLLLVALQPQTFVAREAERHAAGA